MSAVTPGASVTVAVTPGVTPGASVTVAVTPSIIRYVTKKSRPSEFQKLRLCMALSVEACVELCGVTVRTVQRWDIMDI